MTQGKVTVITNEITNPHNKDAIPEEIIKFSLVGRKGGKLVKTKDKPPQYIITPWLTTREAAVYCCMEYNRFSKLAKDIPHGGDDAKLLFHIDILDKWRYSLK